MAYVSGIRKEPAWAKKLCEKIAAEYGLRRTPRCYFYLPKRGKRRSEVVGAHAVTAWNVIEINTVDLKKTKRKVWIVLHELAHFIDADRNGDYQDRRSSGQRTDHHPRSFWDIALPMYKKHRVLEVASKHEYKRGRKLIHDLYDVG